MDREELREVLDSLHDKYNCEEFIALDPISIPHSFREREDIEIAGFLAATIAWGARPMILKSANRMLGLMDNAPAQFIRGAERSDLSVLRGFVHRTFNADDLCDFVWALKSMLSEYGSLGNYFEEKYVELGSVPQLLAHFRERFFTTEHAHRAEKHLSSIAKGAACKRLNMYLRWMVRRDNRGVDFGLWRRIPMSALYMPLDLHSGNMARELGLLSRKQNDWRSVDELTAALREFDAEDPVRYDFALFGAGVSGYLKR